MKLFCLFGLAIAALPVSSFAQQPAPVLPTRNRALELYVEKDLHDRFSKFTSSGLTYTRQLNSIVYFKAGGMITVYNRRSNPVYTAVAADSINSKTWYTHALVGSLTGALEARRSFYQRLSLVAGIELRAGYGSGGMDSAIAGFNGSIGAGSAGYRLAGTGEQPYSVFMAGLRPYLGARLQFGRFYTGLDLGALIQTMTEMQSARQGTDVNVDWDPFGFHGRLVLGLVL